MAWISTDCVSENEWQSSSPDCATRYLQRRRNKNTKVLAIENFLDLTSRYQIWMTRPDAGKPISVFNAKKKSVRLYNLTIGFITPATIQTMHIWMNTSLWTEAFQKCGGGNFICQNNRWHIITVLRANTTIIYKPIILTASMLLDSALKKRGLKFQT